MSVVKLSQGFAKSANEPGAYWTNDYPKGLGLIVRPTGTKSWVLQKSGKKRHTIGHYPVMSFGEARRRAQEILVAPPQPKPLITVQSALEDHLKRMDRRGNTSGPLLDGEVKLYLRDWLNKPLADITRAQCRARHERLTKEVGDQTADRAFRHFRALYNSALKLHDLPTNPTIAIEWHGNRRRDYDRIDLHDFRQRVEMIENPIRRAWYLVALSTALRKTDCSSIEWEHIDFDSRTLHRPNPKGGTAKAFTLPLSQQTTELLCSLPRQSQYVFSANSQTGYILNPREKQMENPHHLRAEYIALATDLGVPTYPKKLLVNHSVPRIDVSDGYVARPDVELCRPYQENISNIVFGG